jgi:hypothetical protein
MLPTDWGKPTRPVLSRISDLRATQFWDKDHLVAKELSQHLSGSERNFCRRKGILWDLAALYPRDSQWGAQPAFVDCPVLDVAPELAKRFPTTTPSRQRGNRE